MGSESYLKSSTVMAIAEGSVYGFSKRVCRAFRNIRDEHVAWPTLEQKQGLKLEMSEWGFPGCIGIADGTLIRLSEKPLTEGESYWCRKKFYAVSKASYVY